MQFKILRSLFVKEIQRFFNFPPSASPNPVPTFGGTFRFPAGVPRTAGDAVEGLVGRQRHLVEGRGRDGRGMRRQGGHGLVRGGDRGRLRRVRVRQRGGRRRGGTPHRRYRSRLLRARIRRRPPLRRVRTGAPKTRTRAVLRVGRVRAEDTRRGRHLVLDGD